MFDTKAESQLPFSNIYGEKIVADLVRNSGYLNVTLRKEARVCPYYVTLSTVLFLSILIQYLAFFNIFITFGVLAILLRIIYSCFNLIVEEEIIVIKGLGYQIKTKSYLKQSSIFIPYEKVQHIFINEVIFKNRVIFLLTILTNSNKEKNKLIPLFTATIPKIDCLELIYRELKTLNN